MENTISNSSSIKAVCFHLAQLLKLNKSKSIVAYKQLLAVIIADQKKVNSEYSYEDFRVMLNNGIVDDSLKAKMNMFKGKIEVKTSKPQPKKAAPAKKVGRPKGSTNKKLTASQRLDRIEALLAELISNR